MVVIKKTKIERGQLTRLVFLGLRYEHNPADWRLFIDSSQTSLKAALLHNGNSKPSIPVGHSTSRKETYNTMKVLLEQKNYPKYT